MNASCPTCSVDLVPDGNDRACPRCSRLFSVALVKAALDDPYRDAPIVDIVPVWRSPPHYEGLAVLRNEEALEVWLGPANTFTPGAVAGLTALVGLGGFVLLFLMGGRFGFIGLAVAAGLMLSLAKLIDKLGQVIGRRRPPKLSRGETIVVDSAGLHRIEIDEAGNVHRTSRSRGSVTKVVELDSKLSVECGGDPAMVIGSHLVLPSEVRRWLLQSIASRLPERDRQSFEATRVVVPAANPVASGEGDGDLRELDLPARIASCAACSEDFVADKNELACPRCGRAFTVSA